MCRAFVTIALLLGCLLLAAMVTMACCFWHFISGVAARTILLLSENNTGVCKCQKISDQLMVVLI